MGSTNKSVTLLTRRVVPPHMKLHINLSAQPPILSSVHRWGMDITRNKNVTRFLISHANRYQFKNQCKSAKMCLRSSETRCQYKFPTKSANECQSNLASQFLYKNQSRFQGRCAKKCRKKVV